MDTLKAAKILALIALAALLGVLAWQAWTVPRQALAELHGLRVDANTLSMETLREAVETRRLADERLKAIQADARAELRALREAADVHLLRTNDAIAGIAAEAQLTIAAVRPVLDSTNTAMVSTTAMVDNLNAIADDLLPDVRAVIQTGTDAARSTAETMSAIEAVAPTLTRNVDQAVCQLPAIAENTAGITHNIKRAIGLPATIFRGIREGFKRIVPFI